MNRAKPKKHLKGGVLIGVLLALILLSLLIPLLVMRIQRESKQTIREVKKTTSFQLAEAGQDRGAWKLRESNIIWKNLMDGIHIAGYNNDMEYTDVDGGTYKIAISSFNDMAVVVSKGRAKGTNEVRAIRAIYSKSGGIVNAMNVDGVLTYKPNLKIHWGPVVTYQSIDQSPSDYFPRKYSAGQIVGRDTVDDSNNGAMPGDNWTTYDYVAFYDLGVSPTIDLDKYRELAKNSNIVKQLRKTSGTTAAAHDTSGGFNSGYYTQSVKMIEPGGGGADVVINCPTCVIFVEGNIAQFPQNAWLDVKALVATGDVDFNARSTDYTATIPPKASLEYQHSTLAGYFAAQGWTDGGSYVVTGCGMHGFLYAGGNLSNAGGGSKMVGAIYVGGAVTTNTMTLYYDKTVANEVETGGSGSMTRQTWDEIATSW